MFKFRPYSSYLVGKKERLEMKKWALAVIIFLVITNTIFIITTVLYKNKTNNKVLKIYTFGGESKDIRISDGVIIISSDKHIIDGGKVEYIGKKQDNIKSYTKTIYLNNHKANNMLLTGAVSHSGDTNGITFPDEFLLNEEVGGINAEKLLSEENISTIKDNLYFSLVYSTKEGKSAEDTIKLRVKEINMDTTK
jgi:hypothetical protein